MIRTPIAQVVECPLRGTGGHWFDILKSLKMLLVAPHLAVVGTQTYRVELGLGRPSVRIMWLGLVPCQVSVAWYFSEAALYKWALSSLLQPDTIEIWLKNCSKRRKNLNNQKQHIMITSAILYCIIYTCIVLYVHVLCHIYMYFAIYDAPL